MKEIMQLIKGESSFWINKNKLCREKFQWQNDYFAVSVSETVVENVREYIKIKRNIIEIRLLKKNLKSFSKEQDSKDLKIELC